MGVIDRADAIPDGWRTTPGASCAARGVNWNWRSREAFADNQRWLLSKGLNQVEWLEIQVQPGAVIIRLRGTNDFLFTFGNCRIGGGWTS